MKNLKKLGVIGIIVVLIIGAIITLTGAEARSTNTYSIKTPKGMEHERIGTTGDYYVYVDEDEYNNSYMMLLYAIDISDGDVLKKDFGDELYKKYENMEDVKDYEDFLTDVVESDEYQEVLKLGADGTVEFSNTKFVRIGKKNYRAICIEAEANTDNEDVIVDEDFKAEIYIVLSDNYMYIVELMGKPSKINKLRKYLNTFEIKDTFSVKGVVGINRTLVSVLLCIGVICILAIVIIVHVITKKKNNDLNNINSIN